MILRCALLCLAIGTLAAAQFNPRVTDRDIAFNESVRVSFSTMRPQLEHIDIDRAVRTSLELPSVQAKWRLIGDPEIKQNEKAKDVMVSLRLRPRVAGQLALPTIPVTWLEGDRSASFGEVTVAEHITVGTDERPLPKELELVGGYSWGSSQSDILERNAGNRVVSEAGGSVRIVTPAGLTLNLIGDKLASATLLAKNLDLAAAESSFVQRWGSPSSESADSITWHIGWLEVVAVRATDGTEVHLTHEGIEGSAARGRVTTEVFSLLEDTVGHAGANPETAPAADPSPAQPATDGPDPAEAPAEAPADGDAEAAPPAPADDSTPAPTMDEIEAELHRRMGE
ncbi:MAG: hypothetical protein PF961_05915 [Planctomycetota bacterium]|jgi:hypothetical protein|nr:hypothetical protein [Planctomycetota bacterium]